MAEQIASLEIALDSRQLVAGSDALAKLSAAANAATASVAGLSTAHANAVAGANQMAAAANTVTAGATRMATAANAAAASATRMAAAATATTAGTAQTAAAANAATASINQLAAAANAAITSINQMSAAANAATAGHGRMTAATNTATASTRQLQLQITNLGFQLNDIVSGILMGQSPFTIMAQQGGQVYQALNGPQGVRAGLANVVTTLAGMASPARLAGAALAAAATVAFVAWNKFENQQLSLIATVKGLGREAGLTADQLRNIGQQGAQRGGLSLRSGTELAQSIVEADPRISAANIERLVAGAKDFSAYFTRGDLQAGQKRMLDLLQDTGQTLLELDKRSNILTSDQRKVVEQAVRYHDANASAAVLLEVINSRAGLYNETTSKIATAWERIGVAVSDIMTKLGPLVNNLLTPLASLLERAAKGLESPNAANNIMDIAATAARGAGPLGAGISAVIMANRYRSGPEYGPPIPENLRPQPEIKGFSAALTRPGATAYSPGDPLTISELGPLSSAGAKAVDDLRTKLNGVRDAAGQVAQVMNDQLDPRLEGVKKRADDVVKTVIPQTESLKDLTAQHRKLAESLFESGKETDDQREASSRLRQAIDSQTDASGKRITSEQLFTREAGIRQRQITDMTVDQRAQTAVEAETLRLVGAGIPLTEARKRAEEAGNLVRIESNQQIMLGNRELEFSRQQIELEGRSLFATAQQRAQANAELAKEQELRRSGRDPSGVDEQVQIRIAGQQARQKQAGAEQQQQFNDIKNAGVNAFTSIATAIASGTKAMDAMTMGAKQLGSALTSGGINQIAQGNFIGGGIEAAVGLGLTFFGADQERKKADRQKKLDDAKTQAEEANRKAEEINRLVGSYLDRITAASLDTSTLQGALASFDVKANKDRAEAAKAGGSAITLLETALGLERTKIQSDFAKRSAELEQQRVDAVLARQQTAQDRIFNAANDNSTLAGKMAALERQFAKERVDELKAGGEAITDLLAAQDAERLRLLKDAGDEYLRAQKAAFDDAKNFLTGELKSISDYLNGLTAGSSSPLSPGDRLAAAQSQFSTQLALAQGGNRDALSGITGNASTLLDAAKAMYASSAGYQAIFAQVQSTLGALPSQVSPEQFIVNAIDAQTDALSAYLASIDTNGDGMISRAEAANTFLATIFNELDVNGDGQLSKLELMRVSATNTEGYTSATASYVNSINTLSASMNNLQAVMTGQLGTQIQLLSTAVTNLILMSKVVWNTAQLVTYNTNGFGSPQYAIGGYIDGPGTSTSDSVRARVSRGEFVTRASSVARIGLPAMNYMNDNGALPANADLRQELVQLRGEVARLNRLVANVGDRIVSATGDVGARVQEGNEDRKKGQSRAPGVPAGRGDKAA